MALVDRRHPLYDDNLSLWELYYDSAKGGENFINNTNLFSHRLEDADDFDERLERAYFLNFCDTIPNIYNSYIFKENIERPPDANLIQFRKNINGRGMTIIDFIKRAGYFASVYGVIHALVGTPQLAGYKPATKAAIKDQNIYPQCSIVFPTQLVDWSIDSQGEWRWVVIESIYYRDADPNADRVEETHYKLITREEWKIEDQDGNAVSLDDESESSGKNTLGIVPIITMYHKDIDGNKTGESMLKDIVYINRAILNWCSCIDEQIERQTFSQLVVPDDGTLGNADEAGEDPLHAIGTSSIWTFPGDANHPPAFISPNVENIQTIWRLAIDHIKEIYRLARLIGSSEDMYASRSGRAAQMGFMSVNSALADKAGSYQQFENDVSKLAYLLLGKNPEEFEDVRYPSTFDVASLGEELDAQIKIMEKNFSPTLNKTIQKNIARRATPLASQTIKGEIEAEIDSGDGIVEPSNPLQQKSMEDGNPNLQNLSQTFKTKGQQVQEDTSKRKEE